ncbi:MAG: hypothetical protein EBQ75_07565 [Actinobacteria bacterium]|nr:hypothetical protein [Actinomycetota bacterium]
MPEVAQAALRTEVRVAVWRVGDRSVDDLGDADVADHRNALTRIEDLLLESFDVGRPQHVGELIGDAVEPHRRRLPLVWSEDERRAFLTQVVTRVGVTKEWQLVFTACFEFGDLFGDQVLVRHRHDRQVATDECHHFTSSITGRVEHDLAFDLGLVGRHRPLVVGVLLECGDALVASHARAHLACGCGHRRSDLRWVDVAVERIPQCADEIVRFEERIAVLQFLGCQHVVFHAVRTRHRRHVLELGHALVRVGEAHRTGDVVVDRVLFVLGEFAIQLG